MEHFSESDARNYLESIFPKLIESGWIDQHGFEDTAGSYGVHWTAKGKERVSWLLQIESELHLGPKGMLALITLCHQQT